MLKKDIEQMRLAYRDLAILMVPNYFITHSFDHPSSGKARPTLRARPRRPEHALEKVSQFYNMMFQEVHGPAWRSPRSPASRRPW